MEKKMSSNKRRKEKFSKEENEAIYEKHLKHIQSIEDDSAEIIQTASTGRFILVDKFENVPGLIVKPRGGYLEVMVRVNNEEKRRTTGTSIGRYILQVTDKSKVIDHINKNPLDNRRSNLRVCSQSENLANRGKVGKINLYKGYKPYGNSFIVECQKEYVKTSVRLYSKDEKRAATVYDCLALKIHGEYADTNFLKEGYTPEFVEMVWNKLSRDIKVTQSHRKTA